MSSDVTTEHTEIILGGACFKPPRIASIGSLLLIMENLYPQTVIFSSKICEILAQKYPQIPPYIHKMYIHKTGYLVQRFVKSYSRPKMLSDATTELPEIKILLGACTQTP